MRIPFSLPLYVGGNSENIAKWIVSPAASAPSRVTTKLLLLSVAELAGVSVRNTFAHSVCAPLIVVEFDASVSPADDSSATVSFPEYDVSEGKR